MVSDALDTLSFSGPVKSMYPQMFIDLNQVSAIKAFFLLHHWTHAAAFPFCALFFFFGTFCSLVSL